MRKHKPKPKRAREAGVTLLEVLVVLAIIALIAALATPRLLQTYGRAKAQAADVALTNVEAAVQVYYLDTGQLPYQADGLSALLAAPPASRDGMGPTSTRGR